MWSYHDSIKILSRFYHEYFLFLPRLNWSRPKSSFFLSSTRGPSKSSISGWTLSFICCPRSLTLCMSIWVFNFWSFFFFLFLQKHFLQIQSVTQTRVKAQTIPIPITAHCGSPVDTCIALYSSAISSPRFPSVVFYKGVKFCILRYTKVYFYEYFYNPCSFTLVTISEGDVFFEISCIWSTLASSLLYLMT